MKGIQWKEFVDDAYLGIDAFFKYHNRKYQYAGWYIKDMDKCYAYVGRCSEDETDFNTIWKVYTNTPNERWQAFLNAKIFEGKTLEEAGDDVEFLDWG